VGHDYYFNTTHCLVVGVLQRDLQGSWVLSTCTLLDR
jgi:hypothetical protein